MTRFIQNPPTKHHYIPAFYTKRWARPETGKLIVYSKPHKGVIAERKHPNATGYVDQLYQLRGFPDALAQQVESKFFKPWDNKGHEALAFLEKEGPAGLRPDLRLEHRWGWIRFIMSLLLRCPEDVEYMRQFWMMHFAVPDRVTDERYQSVRQADMPATFAEFLSDQPPQLVERHLFEALLRLINNEHVAGGIFAMNWATVDTSASRFRLLTSDRPVFHFSFANPNGHIGLPIGPNRLFVATSTPDMMKALQQLSTDEIVKQINGQVVGQAQRFVYASDESQARFIANRFGAARPPRLVETFVDGARLRKQRTA